MLPRHPDVRKAVLALLLAVAPVWSAALPSDADLAAIEKAVDAKRAELHVPGAALAIVADDRVVLLKGFGLRDVERKLPVTPNTLFAIGSCTKAFTAAAVLMAADDGKLALTDPPRKYLPYFRLRDDDADSKITIGDLMCHRSGLSRTDLAWYTNRLTPAEVIRVAGQAKATAKLGEKWQYQNVMFLAAGEIAARAEGTPYPRLVARRIFAPLGMRLSRLDIGALKGGRDFARGYSWDGGAKRWDLVKAHDVACIAPAGAINSSARDMASWLRFMMGDGAFEGKRLLSEKSFAELTARHMAMGPASYYGFGWMVHDWRGERIVEHGGNIDGYNASVAYLPDKHVGLVILTNVFLSALPGAATDIVFERLTGKTAPPPAPAPAAAGPAPVPPEKEAGIYDLSTPPVKMSVTFQDGKLTLVVPGQPAYPLERLDGRRYRLGAPAPAGFFATFRPAKDKPEQTEMFLEQPQGNAVLVREPAAPYKAPLTAEELRRKAVAAAGGEANLRRHHSLVLRYRVQFDDQGVGGRGVTYLRVPGAVATEVELRGAGKSVGRVRDFCDGMSGGVTTTFAGSSAKSETDVADAVNAAAFYGPLDWPRLFKTVEITGVQKMSGEDVYVVKKTPERGSPITDYYSAKTFLLRKRDALGATEVFTEYRKVDGVMIPFTRVSSGAGGLPAGTLWITQARFDVPLDDGVFQPPMRAPRPDLSDLAWR